MKQQFPLAPEEMKIDTTKKLVGNFCPKYHHVLHYRNLKQYFELGMILKKVHRGISFYQSRWMEPYIKKNRELRKLASNSSEKDFFKLMNNSVFGKTIDNIRKRQNVILIDNHEQAIKLSSKPNSDGGTIFDEHLIAAHMKKERSLFQQTKLYWTSNFGLVKNFNV